MHRCNLQQVVLVSPAVFVTLLYIVSTSLTPFACRQDLVHILPAAIACCCCCCSSGPCQQTIQNSSICIAASWVYDSILTATFLALGHLPESITAAKAFNGLVL